MGGAITMDDALFQVCDEFAGNFQDALDEFLEAEAEDKKKGYEAWSHVRDADRPTRTYEQIVREDAAKVEEKAVDEAADEEEEGEMIGEMIDLEFARPPKDEEDCESICSTYSNLLNRPKVIGWI